MPKINKPMEFIRFIGVGGIATLTHMAVGSTLITQGFPALWSNPVAFCVAFGVSFVGHNYLTFPDQNQEAKRPTQRVLRRFFAVAVGGFLLNELILALLLVFTSIPPILALLLSTGTAAVSTFVFSKKWAFASN